MWRLREAYGPVKRGWRRSPIDQLVATVLSQHTSDSNTDAAFSRLKARFPTWEEVIRADVGDLADAIRVGGLANIKAARIPQILSAIRERRGALEIDFLRDLPLEEAKAWLRELPGVGPKTAAVVLVFAFDMPALPVDTHIYRVSKRLGLISKRTTAERAHDILEAMVEPADVFEFHVLLITHGRETCRAQRPRCPACALREDCPSAPGFEKAAGKRENTLSRVRRPRK
jgi:endonuclease-3